MHGDGTFTSAQGDTYVGKWEVDATRAILAQYLYNTRIIHLDVEERYRHVRGVV